MKEKTKRNSSIELLRIISMIGVVILHYNNASMGGALGMVLDGSPNQYYLYLIESLFVCAVNVFVMISAYFLACNQNRKLIKILELFVQVIVFNLVFYVFGVLRGHKVFTVSSLISSLLPANYFLILYSVLYIISPYLNLIIKQLNKEQYKRLLIILMLIFSVWTIVIDVAENITGNTYLQYTATWYYNNPIIILMSAYILLFFMDIHFESKIINELAKAAFTCFLFHEFLLRHIRIEQFVNRGILVLIVHQLGSALIIYLISYIVYKIYHLCSHWFFKLIEPYINKINISVEKG